MDIVNQSGTDPKTAKEHPVTAKQFRLGVLLVHGIGTQPPRDTLVRWGDVLLKTIGLATENQVNAMVERGRPGDGSGDQPAEVEIRIRAVGKEEHWLLAECWWAGAFPAPSYRELVSWSVRAVPWSIAIHIAQRYWQEGSQETLRAKLIAPIRAMVQLLVALTLAPVFIFLLALALLLGLLPIPQLRTVILSAQSTLTGTVGDSLAFVESPVRAAFIMTRILEGLERLKESCDHALIVAHSQGAAVVLNALGGIVVFEGEPDSESGQESPPARPVPDTLLTFGSGVNQLASLKRLSAGLPRKLGVNPVNAAVIALLATVVLSGLLYMQVNSQRTNVMSILKAAGLYGVIIAIVGLVFWALLKIIPRMRSKPTGRKEEGREDWLTWVAVAVVSITIIAANIYARALDLPYGSVNFLSIALFMLAVSLRLILSSDMKKVVTENVQMPPGLARWVDLYASADPVPNGKTRVVDDAKLVSVPVWNLGSPLSDHTTYWDNLDGFVLRVVRECARTAKSEWQKLLPRETNDLNRRAEWRVGFLRLARWSNSLAWLVALVLLWQRYAQRVPIPFDLPAWLPPSAQTPARFALLAAAVAVAAWATFYIQCWFWSLWVRAEQAEALTGTVPADKSWIPFIGMGVIVTTAILLARAIGRGDWAVVSELLANPGEVMGELLILVIGGSLILTVVARWLWPEPPRPSEAPIIDDSPTG